MLPAFQPLLPWNLLVPAGLLFVAALGFLSWRGAAGLPRKRRSGLLALRLAATTGVLFLLANPGRWVGEDEEARPEWGLLVDSSASMATPDADGLPRIDAAERVAAALLGGSAAAAHPHRFAADLGERWEAPAGAAALSDPADPSEGSRLDLAVSALLDRAARSAAPWTGIVVVGDGRQTGGDERSLAEVADRARALGIPVHVVPLGGSVARRDLGISLARRQFVALPNQSVAVAVAVANDGLPPVRAELRLSGPAGEEIARLALDAGSGETAAGEFTLGPEAPAGEYLVELAAPPEDEHPGNDRAAFRLDRLEKPTRVLLLEGAPYWDTKFLAQLLREQGLVEVEAVYRVRPERFYRIRSGGDDRFRETDEVFPETDAALGDYDLVVLGKGAEAFLTPERIARLGRFVRDRGGALLFSRGKPYAGSLPGLEFLETGRWGDETRAEYRFLPTADGEESGLFRERLPARDSAVWTGLPPLEDVRAMAELRPFTRVLAVGERVGGGAKVPLLLARRHGRGMVAAVNGDGLWRWGFRPGGEEAEDWHGEFWTQILQWAATYSEFLPGEDFSLQLGASSIALGESVRVRVGYRGGPAAPAPSLRLTGPETSETSAAPTGKAEDGTPRWGAILSPKTPGTYAVELHSGEDRGPTAVLEVRPPASERDDPSADPDTLAALAAASGGEARPPETAAELLSLLEPDASPEEAGAAVWSPLWNRPWILCGIALLLGMEWAARRRLGLI